MAPQYIQYYRFIKERLYHSNHGYIQYMQIAEKYQIYLYDQIVRVSRAILTALY